jgi:hypothetical protein
MKLGDQVVVHATEEAKKKWEEREKPVKRRTYSCPSCEIGALKKQEGKTDYSNDSKSEESKE